MSREEPLPPDRALALAWQPAAGRPALAALFSLDRHLATLVRRASEPMLGQLRLAWWRERLMQGQDRVPAGEPVLADLWAHWPHGAAPLVQMVDAWEELLAPDAMDRDAIARFSAKRSAPFAALGGQAAGDAARVWALADFAAGTSRQDEARLAGALAAELAGERLVPRDWRGVAVLGALGRYALATATAPGEGRRAAVIAWRVGLLGL